MSRCLSRLPFAVLVVAAMTSIASGAASTRPASTRPSAPDLSTPRSAALTFADAMAREDAPAARSLCVGSQQDLDLVDAIVAAIKARQKLVVAARDKFGAAGASVAREEQTSVGQQMARDVADAALKIEGDRATITPRGDREEPLKLRKVGEAWKMDMAAMLGSEGPDRIANTYRAMAKAYDQTAAEIQAGKYKTAQEANDVFAPRLNAALSGVIAPTTQPTTRP